jgi:hypothetical protein
MSGAEKIPDVECDQTSQSEDPAQFLTEPGHNQPHANSYWKEGQTNPFLMRRPWTSACHAFADGEHKNKTDAENAPYASCPADYECE